MPSPIKLKVFNNKEIAQKFGKPKTFTTKFPKQSLERAALKSSLKTWQQKQVLKDEPKLKEKKITATRLRASDIAKIKAIKESTSPSAEAIIGQKFGPDEILGTLYSSLTALEFTKMETEFKSRMSQAKDPISQRRIQSQWNKVVEATQQAYAAAGLKGLKETDLKNFTKELTQSKANLNSIVDIANTGIKVKGTTEQTLTVSSSVIGGFVPFTGVLADPSQIVNTITDLCDKPFAEGVFTKNFSKSFSLKVTLTVWCPTFWKPWRTCKKTYTLAGVSFSMGIEVGYRVSCCGAVAWGSAYAEACATIIGIKVCAGCYGTIVGVAGIGRTGSGNNCTYGIGINAQLKCTFAGITVFQVQVPFGYNVNGPCPPAGLCN